MRTFHRRRKNHEATLQRYRQRILNIPQFQLQRDLHGAYISDYCDVMGDFPTNSHVYTLMEVCSERNVIIRGLLEPSISPPDGESRVVYVGPTNNLTNRKRTSYSINPDDVVYK